MIATAQITITNVYDGKEGYSTISASRVPSNPTISLVINRSGVALNPLQYYNPTGSSSITTFANNTPVKVSTGKQEYCYYADTQILDNEIIVYTPASDNIVDLQEQVSEFGDDDKLTPMEKQALQIEWNTIVDEHTKLMNIASNFTDSEMDSGVITAKNDYNFWYVTSLTPYITPLLVDLSTTTDLGTSGASTYRTVLSSYYAKRNTLSTAISEAMKITYDSKFIQQADKIGLVVTESFGESIINSASIIESINNNGIAKIAMEATNIDLTGLVSFYDLETEGSGTTIHGGNIETETITATQIALNTITADNIKAGELVVGTNVTMGENATIEWTKVNSKPSIPSQYTNAEALAAWVASGYKTHIDINGIYTGAVNANQINGNTFTVTDFMQFVKNGVTLFKLSPNVGGTAGQLYLNGNCSLDTNGSDLRLKVADNNYIRINSAGGVDYYFPTTTAPYYKVVPIIDSNGNLCNGGGTATLVFG
jgi:hypothetical protein